MLKIVNVITVSNEDMSKILGQEYTSSFWTLTKTLVHALYFLMYIFSVVVSQARTAFC